MICGSNWWLQAEPEGVEVDVEVLCCVVVGMSSSIDRVDFGWAMSQPGGGGEVDKKGCKVKGGRDKGRRCSLTNVLGRAAGHTKGWRREERGPLCGGVEVRVAVCGRRVGGRSFQARPVPGFQGIVGKETPSRLSTRYRSQNKHALTKNSQVHITHRRPTP